MECEGGRQCAVCEGCAWGREGQQQRAQQRARQRQWEAGRSLPPSGLCPACPVASRPPPSLRRSSLANHRYSLTHATSTCHTRLINLLHASACTTHSHDNTLPRHGSVGRHDRCALVGSRTSKRQATANINFASDVRLSSDVARQMLLY